MSLHLAEYGVSGPRSLEFCSGHRNPLKVIKQEKKRGHAKILLYSIIVVKNEDKPEQDKNQKQKSS